MAMTRRTLPPVCAARAGRSASWKRLPVLTMITSPQRVCWAVATTIDPARRPRVKAKVALTMRGRSCISRASTRSRDEPASGWPARIAASRTCGRSCRNARSAAVSPIRGRPPGPSSSERTTRFAACMCAKAYWSPGSGDNTNFRAITTTASSDCIAMNQAMRRPPSEVANRLMRPSGGSPRCGQDGSRRRPRAPRAACAGVRRARPGTSAGSRRRWTTRPARRISAFSTSSSRRFRSSGASPTNSSSRSGAKARRPQMIRVAGSAPGRRRAARMRAMSSSVKKGLVR